MIVVEMKLMSYRMPQCAELNWYSNCGHQEKRDKMNELLEVTHDQREKEVYPRV
jgi:hypothetical protein